MLTIAIGSVVGIVVMLIGQSLVKLFHIEPAGFLIGAGLIVVVFAVPMVVSPTAHDDCELTDSEVELRIAIYPLAIPLLITPAAVVAFTAIGIDAAVTDETLVGALLALLAVMVVNLPSLLVLARYEAKIPSAAWDVAGRLLGIFLVAFGVSIIIEGVKLIA